MAVKVVFQIADLHIPNTEEKRPYSQMIKKFLSEFYSVAKNYERDEIRIVVCGDTFHNKIRISNEAKSMFHETMNYLNAIGKTIIIAGNHDMLENNKDKQDSITPTFSIKDVYPDTIYADKELDYKSGLIEDDDIVWVLYSIHDKYKRPDMDNIREEYPNKKIIGLFHGDIVGASTDSGRIVEHGIPFDYFDGCHCVMGGHIHKYQEIRKNGIPIVYSSSVFQQNSGENTTQHGFVEWDLETMSHELHEVSNDYKIYKFKVTSYDDVKNGTEKLFNL